MQKALAAMELKIKETKESSLELAYKLAEKEVEVKSFGDVVHEK